MAGSRRAWNMTDRERNQDVQGHVVNLNTSGALLSDARGLFANNGATADQNSDDPPILADHVDANVIDAMGG